jgi:non-ribosomal peptide synthetase component E (peptide arylation enzyme)
MLPAFSMESMLDAIVTFKIAEILLVPPLLIRLVRDPIVDKYDLSHVTRFSSGAAPLSPEILALLQKKFPNTGFKQGYGMTESCSCITAHPQDKFDYKYAHTGGTIVSKTEVKVIDPDTGKELGYDEPGEIWARGPQIVMGYLNNPKATYVLPAGHIFMLNVLTVSLQQEGNFRRRRLAAYRGRGEDQQGGLHNHNGPHKGDDQSQGHCRGSRRARGPTSRPSRC